MFVFINKVILVNKRFILFIYCLWLLISMVTRPTEAELSSCKRDHMVHKV